MSPRYHSHLHHVVGFIVLSICSGLGIVTASRAADLPPEIATLVERHAGEVAVAIEDVASGERLLYRADEPMPTASLIKLAVMAETYRQASAGMVDFESRVTLRDSDKVPGSGILTSHFTAGAQITLRDAVRLMVAFSDNTATNLVLDRIGLAATSQTMETWGLPNTKIHAQVFRRETSIFPERSQQFGLGSTTANETLSLLRQIQAGSLVSSEASAAMKQHLLACEDKTKLARKLPPGIKIAHKTGAVSNIRCDAGIIEAPRGPLLVCVLTNKNRDQSWGEDNAADLLCAEIARAAFDCFNSDVTVAAADAGPLRSGANGERVEWLQRTLNARLEPSPMLSIDGDFGSVTEAAVKRFQEAHQLTPTGIVEEATWRALGPVLVEDAARPAPSEVNAQEVVKSPADMLDGPPFVTCKAWGIADVATGQLLSGANAETALDIASTTKVMTAYMVLRLAESQPAVMEEEVVFSPRADQTPGSTAGIRAGERLPVRALLYGLLLPSGNDAATALAEHFGARLTPADVAPHPEDSVAGFVLAMNRTADELGMSAATFKNPHGLTAEGHRASVADLAKLASAALKSPVFRGYVSTRRYGYTVRGTDGYERNVIWENTNQLLATEGYLGVKTGTTDAAGACLVACGVRDNQELLVVVLGSAASAARYTDTRNLFRWAWQEQAAGRLNVGR